jgi:hypothetical protein
MIDSPRPIRGRSGAPGLAPKSIFLRRLKIKLGEGDRSPQHDRSASNRRSIAAARSVGFEPAWAFVAQKINLGGGCWGQVASHRGPPAPEGLPSRVCGHPRLLARWRRCRVPVRDVLAQTVRRCALQAAPNAHRAGGPGILAGGGTLALAQPHMTEDLGTIRFRHFLPFRAPATYCPPAARRSRFLHQPPSNGGLQVAGGSTAAADLANASEALGSTPFVASKSTLVGPIGNLGGGYCYRVASITRTEPSELSSKSVPITLRSVR